MEKKVDLALHAIQHIGIPVADLERSLIFYHNLGFKEVMKSHFESGGEKGTAVMMKQNEVMIELYQMPPGELVEIRNRKDGHIDHIAFDVPDIDHVFRTLKDAGYEIEDDKPVHLDFWDKGCRYFTIIGPDGERLEFNQIL